MQVQSFVIGATGGQITNDPGDLITMAEQLVKAVIKFNDAPENLDCSDVWAKCIDTAHELNRRFFKR